MSTAFKRFTLDQLANEDYLGYCIKCGTEHGECEPDARRRKCQACGSMSVYGGEEIGLMGLINFDEEGE